MSISKAEAKSSGKAIPKLQPAKVEGVPTIEQLRDKMAYWQSILGIRDWHIKLEWMGGREFVGDLGKWIRVAYRREGLILLRHPDDIGTGEDNIFDPLDDLDVERKLVHELLHVRAEPYAAKLDEPDGEGEDSTNEAKEHHQFIHELSGILVTFQRTVDEMQPAYINGLLNDLGQGLTPIRWANDPTIKPDASPLVVDEAAFLRSDSTPDPKPETDPPTIYARDIPEEDWKEMKRQLGVGRKPEPVVEEAKLDNPLLTQEDFNRLHDALAPRPDLAEEASVAMPKPLKAKRSEKLDPDGPAKGGYRMVSALGPLERVDADEPPKASTWRPDN